MSEQFEYLYIMFIMYLRYMDICKLMPTFRLS